jgi:mRNA (guanine-N7-)-methyltransferase
MYPTEQPNAKCDLVSPKLPIGSLKDSFSFDSTASIFQALKQPVPRDLKLLSTLYTYPSDAPTPPISRSLVIIGVADVSLSVIRKLIGDPDDGLVDRLVKSTVAVRRADGVHAEQIEERHRDNSLAFSQFARRLQSENVVAIVAPDKLGRFGIFTPSTSLNEEGVVTSHDFYGWLYMGKVDAVRDYLTPSIVASPAQIENEYKQADGGTTDLWKPPEASDALWQPPETGDATAAGLWQPPSITDSQSASFDLGATTFASINRSASSNKRKRYDFHGDSGAAAADAFYSSLTRTLETRADSRIYHMRAFNGWVKATQIQELNPRTRSNKDGPLRILDLACGKGGDLGKWVLHSRGVQNYVGSDVARGSLKDAAIRARKMRQKLQRCTFTCADLGADVPGRVKGSSHKLMQKLLTWSMQDERQADNEEPIFKMVRGGGISSEDHFDVISIQFAIHYMMSSKKRARRFFRTVGELLDVGGNLIITTIDARVVIWHLMGLGLDLNFEQNSAESPKEAVISVGNGVCKLRFQPDVVKRIFSPQREDTSSADDLFGLEYSFTLVEGDDHRQGVGDAVNLPEWLTPIPTLCALAEEAGLQMESAENFHEFYNSRSNPTTNAAAHTSMYNMRVLNRNGSIADDEWEISRMYVALKFRKVKETTMQVDEIEDEDGADDDDDDEEELSRNIDPEIKARLMPMAMMKAKKAVGSDAWQSLTSEEKSRLTGVELVKLTLQSA